MKLFATCARGLEDVSAAEVAELTGACATLDVNKVMFAATWRQVCDLQVRARTLHKLHLLLARAEVGSLDDIAAAARQVDWAAHLAPEQKFAVRPVRSGSHGFTSVDVGRVVGKAVGDQVLQATGRHPPVDLTAPDVEVSALVRDGELVLGLNLTGESLHARGYRTYQHPAPLRPTLAAAILRWAPYVPEAGLWDPMCGSGTVLIEAAMMARNVPPNPARAFQMERLRGFPAEALAAAREAALAEVRPDAPAPLLGTEKYEKHLLGAAANARSAGVWDAMQLRVLDATLARREDLLFPPGLAVVNPPYGLRIGSKRVVVRLYEHFLRRIARLGVGRLVALVGNTLFEEAAARQGLAPAEGRSIMYGDLTTRLVRFDLAAGAASAGAGGATDASGQRAAPP